MTITIKSPFYVVEDFLSPKQCEELVSQYEVRTPNLNRDGDPIKLERTLTADKGQTLVMSKLRSHIESIEHKYDALYVGTEPIVITHYPEFQKAPASPPTCENSHYVKRRWIKTKDIELTGIVWLKDYQDEVPLDPRYEVFGGKTELPAYNFSLVPQRGTLIMFPAYPHFITCISPVLVGDLYQLKINMSITEKDGSVWLYDPSKFRANGTDFLGSWFNEYI